jgi:hypothetical protein
VLLEEAPSVFDAAAAPSDFSDVDAAVDGVEDFSASMAFLRDSEG